MRMAAFATTASTSVLRASASPNVSVDRIGERAATLIWTAASPRATFTIHYGPQGARHSSLRTVAHSFVHLRGLRPGMEYAADIKDNTTGTTETITFTTNMSGDDLQPATQTEQAEEMTELSRLEIRVGKILSCEKHPDADSLYVEQVDVGEEEPRTIVSGLVKFLSLDEMVGRNVIVLCNLKPRAMRGVTSYGMLMCASNEDHTQVDPLSAPADTPIGELITFSGHKASPIDPGNRASKAFDRIAESLRCTDDGVAKFEDTPFITSKGPCVSPKGLVGPVS